MAELKAQGSFDEGSSLSVCIYFLGLEHSESWEGWVNYQLELHRQSEVLSKTEGSILDGDIGELINTLKKGQTSQSEMEPLEPDFQVMVRPADDEVEIQFFIDEGIHQGQGYSDTGVGLRMIASKKALDRFAEAIESDRRAVVQGRKYKL